MLGLKKALLFKMSADELSIKECMKHIAASEKQLLKMVEVSFKQPINPEKRAGIKYTDLELLNAVKDRRHKSKTFAALEPAS